MTTKVTAALIDSTGLDTETVGGLTPAAIAAPIGSIMMWPLDAVHADYYEMDGSTKDTTTDAALFAVIGYTYGGSGASFTLPDYRGYFPRGKDNGATNDPDAAGRTDRGDGTTGDVVGSKQVNATAKNGLAASFPMYHCNGGATGTYTGGWGLAGAYQGAKANTITGDNETRPTNVAVLFCIKYK